MNFAEALKYFGPALLISIAYVDPGNCTNFFSLNLVSGDISAGLSGSYSLLWILALTTIFGFFFQKQAIVIGVVTGNDLSSLVKKGFKKKTAYLIWIMTELAIFSADIQEVLGASAAMKILFGIEIWKGILITRFITRNSFHSKFPSESF